MNSNYIIYFCSMEEVKHDKNKSAGWLIAELSRAAQMYFQHAFKQHQIGPAQIRTLIHIAHNEGLTQKEVGQNLNLDKSSITSQLQILEKNGYIERRKSERDARELVLGITDKTQALLPDLRKVLKSWTDTLLDGFTEDERAEVFKILLKMKANAEDKLSAIQQLKEEER